MDASVSYPPLINSSSLFLDEHFEFAGSQINENISVAASTTVDLLNISPGVPGYVHTLFLDTNSTDGVTNRDSILKVYIDGESTPSINCHLGGFGLDPAITASAGSQFEADGAIVIMKHLKIEWVSNMGTIDLTFQYPIPYKSSCHITLTTPSSGGYTLTSQAWYMNGYLPYKLWSNCLTWQNRLVQQTWAQLAGTAGGGNYGVQFLNLPTGTEGWVVYFQVTYANNNNGTGTATPTCLENNIVAYLQGRTPGVGTFAQLDTAGGENFFQSSKYFEYASWIYPKSCSYYAIINAGTSNSLKGPVTACMDWLDFTNTFNQGGGLHFANGILLTLEVGQRTNHGTTQSTNDCCYNVLYYTRY